MRQHVGNMKWKWQKREKKIHKIKMTKARALFFKMHFHRGTKAAAPSASAAASASAATAPLAISTLRFVSFQLVPAAPVAFPFVCNMQHCTQSPVLSAVPPSVSLPPTCVFFQMANTGDAFPCCLPSAPAAPASPRPAAC